MTELITQNKIEIVNTIKLLLYKEQVSLFEKLDFEDDDTFLEPLLFSYFNSNKENTSLKGVLEELLQPYFLDKEGRLLNELPLKKDDLEIVKEIHPLLGKYFRESARGELINPNPEHNSVWKAHYQQLFDAVTIIKTHLPEFYAEFAFANKKVYLHDNSNILNFTSIETLGMSFFYVIGTDNLIYFIEELIHQGSHNYLYYVIHNRTDFFKIDVDTLIMRDYTNQQWDYRTIYGAFHGLFTVTQRVEYFDQLLTKNVFSGREKHELLGRLTDQFERFRTGLESLDFNQIYTEKGIALYNELDTKCEAILKKYVKLRTEFDLSNRNIDFRYTDFCKLNPLEDFLEKDKKGFFNF